MSESEGRDSWMLGCCCCCCSEADCWPTGDWPADDWSCCGPFSESDNELWPLCDDDDDDDWPSPERSWPAAAAAALLKMSAPNWFEFGGGKLNCGEERCAVAVDFRTEAVS